MLLPLLERLRAGQAIASMGYPDIVLSEEQIETLLQGREVKFREDSDKICKRHGRKPHPVPDSESLFELYGASLDVYDITDERGCEIVLDLNYPFPANSCEQYDYVLDVGTLEHCFNIAQALVNMASLLKIGGVIFHENPFNCGNHGFYNLNPTLFHDFYTDNGFEIVDCKLIAKNGAAGVPLTKRFGFIESEANLLTIAKRVEVQPMQMPTQTKYRKKT